MKVLGILIAVGTVAKGLLLALDPERFARLARGFMSLFPAPARDAGDRTVSMVLECGERAPGGPRTVGWLIAGSGLLVLTRMLRG